MGGKEVGGSGRRGSMKGKRGTSVIPSTIKLVIFKKKWKGSSGRQNAAEYLVERET